MTFLFKGIMEQDITHQYGQGMENDDELIVSMEQTTIYK
jgi:hypothetical protein